MSRLPPQFGPFEPIQRLGAGGMAETFVAVRRGPSGFEQRVCIKRILPAYESDKDFVDAFLREARTMAQLRHAHIVQVLDFGEADDCHYLALELVDGVDLRALLKRRGRADTPLDHEIVTLVASDLCLALDHAHGGGQGREPIVHRDLSPSNVMASRAGEIKLTDFGIARAIGGTPQTATGIIKGKVPYLPPEYIERGSFEVRSDLFSLGVMLYELLAGTRPFDGESDLDTVRRIVSGERRPLRDLAPQAPDALVRCIEQLIAPAIEARPENARAVLDALPNITSHRVRQRLGELVRAELGEIATGEAAHLVPRRTPSQGVPAGAIPGGDTRTRPEARKLGRGPKLAVAAAALSVVVLGAAAGARSYLRPPDVPKAPPPPTAEAYAAAPREIPAGPAATSAPTQAPTTDLASDAAPAAPTRVHRERQGEFRVVVLPFGEVWVDGKPRGHAPVTLKLSPGSHDLGWGDGRVEQKRTLHVTEGQRESLVLHRNAGG